MFILIVDNNRFFISVLQTLLLNSGFNCIESSDNGLDCVFEINKGDTPEVIIIDESQCFINGFDILKNIRHSQRETRIIILTREDSELNNSKPAKNDFVFYMVKSKINADNLPQLLYDIFTQKISSTKIPTANKVFSSLRRSFTGMLNF
jgi:DNA-binding NarL/FixJ family response regulator